MSSQTKEDGSAKDNSSSEAAVAAAAAVQVETESYAAATTDGLVVSKPATREGYMVPMMLYSNFWFPLPLVERIKHLQDSFKAHHEDIIISTYPKCGTTWLKALVFAITNRCRYDFDTHPLLSRHPQQVVPFMEIIPQDGGIDYMEKLSSPRLFATHVPLSLLPNSIASSGCRIIYMSREPKDAFVSRWIFDKKVSKEYSIDLDAAFGMFSEGFTSCGPFWEHCLEYWKESVANPHKTLFLRYEDVMLEPVKHVKKLAAFLGIPFSLEEEEDGVPEKVVMLCSFENLSNLSANKTGEISRHGNLIFEKASFFRKGKVGDWVNHMSQEMGKMMDCLVEEKLKGSGLVL